MSRIARNSPPGSLQHVISRFVNREFRLTSPSERSVYLDSVGRAVPRSDWTPLTYALMSTHVHLAFVAGQAPLERLVRSVNTRVACHLNRARARLGPVFAGRPTSVGLDEERTAALVAYIHNNPVRAGVVRDPVDSLWTPHSAFLGEAPAPPWLDVARSLALCGFDSSPSGRTAFHEFVVARADAARDPALSGDGARALRCVLRRSLQAPVELAGPRLSAASEGTVQHGILAASGTTLRPVWDGAPEALVRLVAKMTGVSLAELTSRRRTPRISSARRLVVLAGRELGFPFQRTAPLVSISRSAACHLAEVPGDAHAAAVLIASRLRGEAA